MFQSFKNEPPQQRIAYWLPEFLDFSVGSLKNEYNFEWKRYLLKKNLEEVKTWAASKERFIFYSPNIVNCVFNICKMLKQPPEVRYLAIDVLDRFLVEHFFEVGETFGKMEEKSVVGDWQTIVERILSQSMLRILTCIQLAMKFCWSCNILSATAIQEIMENLGQADKFSKRSIIKSEARIYKNLNYNISNKTPLLYLEMFFDDFQKHEYFQDKFPLHGFFTTCIHVLDVAITHHQQIYTDYVTMSDDRTVASKGPPEDLSYHPWKERACLQWGTQRLALSADFVVLAASVIYASSALKNPTMETSNILLRHVCTIGECEMSHVRALGGQLLNLVIRNRTFK